MNLIRFNWSDYVFKESLYIVGAICDYAKFVMAKEIRLYIDSRYSPVSKLCLYFTVFYNLKNFSFDIISNIVYIKEFH